VVFVPGPRGVIEASWNISAQLLLPPAWLALSTGLTGTIGLTGIGHRSDRCGIGSKLCIFPLRVLELSSGWLSYWFLGSVALQWLRGLCQLRYLTKPCSTCWWSHLLGEGIFSDSHSLPLSSRVVASSVLQLGTRTIDAMTTSLKALQCLRPWAWLRWPHEWMPRVWERRLREDWGRSHDAKICAARCTGFASRIVWCWFRGTLGLVFFFKFFPKHDIRRSLELFWRCSKSSCV
jgi:hypothetical protein